ncbi:MAG TPA: nucleotidyltransferase family protein [Acidimicrobiales bacterium]|nr:nucleotidyltransferase family protein [Acidimicrobiales bacterium]
MTRPGARAGSPAPGDSGVAVAAVLLCAGEGTRFSDGHKLLADFRGRPLAAWAVEPVLDAGLPLVVVAGATDLSEVLAPFGPAVTVLENPRWRDGQAASLRAGLAWCDARGYVAAVVGLGDQPLVPPTAWRTVAATTLAPIVTASFGGRRRPPVRLGREVWPLLSAEGDEGARELMRRRPDLVAEVACEGDPADVDTVEDLLTHDRQEGASVGGRRSEVN